MLKRSPAALAAFLIVTLAQDARALQGAANVLFHTHSFR